MEPVFGGRAVVRDVAVAVAVAVVHVVGAVTAPPSDRAPDALAYALLLTGALALVVRRQAPVAVLFLTGGCLLGYAAPGYPGLGPAVSVFGAAYTAARAGRRTGTVAIGVVLLTGILAASLVRFAGTLTPEARERWTLLVGWFVAAGVLGEVSRQRRAYVHQVEQRALEAERTREETAQRRAAEERLRIARELHDSLTHSISIIKVQAGVAVHLARKRGEQAPEALVAIQEASAEAMRELRATLEVLRHPEDGPADGDTTGNGLDRLDDLLERARLAGLPATVTITGRHRRLPEEVDRAAYRIVQEALTNVARHAGPASARIHLDYGGDCLTVQVDDDGRAEPGNGTVHGVGLIGMRERVTALGGQLSARARPGGGFTVRAELPAGVAS